VKVRYVLLVIAVVMLPACWFDNDFDSFKPGTGAGVAAEIRTDREAMGRGPMQLRARHQRLVNLLETSPRHTAKPVEWQSQISMVMALWTSRHSIPR
jgi:hypothetical protein